MAFWEQRFSEKHADSAIKIFRMKYINGWSQSSWITYQLAYCKKQQEQFALLILAPRADI